MSFKTSVFVICLICAGLADAQVNDAALKAGIESLKKDNCMKNASWSIAVLDSSGKKVVSYNENISLEPASLIKITSTGAALDILGPQYRFKTTLEYNGYIDSSGTLQGNIYLHGYGDPTTGSARFGIQYKTAAVFENFYSAMVKQGIVAINGDIIADATFFDELAPLPGWLWEDIGNYYASGAYALNINENFYRIYFDAGSAVGSPASIVSTDPEIESLRLINHALTGPAGSGDNVFIFGSPYNGLRIIKGTVPLGKKNFSVEGAIPDPPLFYAEMMMQYIKAKGIAVSGTAKNLTLMQWEGFADTSSREHLHTHYSPPLSDIVYQTNIKSVNLFAEAMVKVLGAEKGSGGSASAGLKIIHNHWVSLGINSTGLNIEDGCGLARTNKINTLQLTGILLAIKKSKAFPFFYQSLPVAGLSGGMASLLKGTHAENNMRAKTGNMSGIKSYAGYVKNKSGSELCFAIIVNNFTCSASDLKKKLEQLMLLISES